MSVIAPVATDEPELFPAGSVDAGIYATHTEGFQHGLVVLAMKESCWLIEAEDGHHLRVEERALDAVRSQLAFFDAESVGWPPRRVVEPARTQKHLPLSPWFWVLAVFAVFWAQGEWPGLTDAGLLDAGRVFGRDEWWRAGSALWLHGDLGHLVSNAGGGLLVFSAVVATFGLGAGWALIAAAAVGGNIAAVVLQHGEQYRSLGASTAIFAALGLLAGRAIRVLGRSGHPHRWRTTLVPLAAGLIVLGLYGAGGVEVDVLAHATGFGSGLLAGFAAAAADGGSQAKGTVAQGFVESGQER
jgi:membrane associated rhomboid family serine protease